MILFALLLLVGCASKQAEDSDANQVNDADKIDSIIKAYAPAVAALLVNKDKNNLYYKFDQGGDDPSQYNIWINGDKMKIAYPPYKSFFKYYDTVYANNAAKTAVAYCYNMDNKLCRDNQGPIDLNYADATSKTPYTWLNEIPTEAKVIGSEQVDKSDATVISYGDTKMWIDDFYKVPVRVVSGGKTWNYEIINAGNIQDNDVDVVSP